jgi:hypothetical protein
MTTATQIRYGEVMPHLGRKPVDPLGVTFGRRPTALVFDRHTTSRSMPSIWIDLMPSLLRRFSAGILRVKASAKQWTLPVPTYGSCLTVLSMMLLRDREPKVM